MIVVSNASPLIDLAIIKRFDLLQEVFGKIYIPEAVYREIAIEGKGKVGAKEVEAGLNKWIEKKKAEDTMAIQALVTNLGDGEAESIVLGLELNADILLINEKKARKIAKFMGLRVMGTIGLLKLVKRRGITIDLKVAIDTLKKKGFRISGELYQEVVTEEL